jgi:hypothetical protein
LFADTAVFARAADVAFAGELIAVIALPATLASLAKFSRLPSVFAATF